MDARWNRPACKYSYLLQDWDGVAWENQYLFTYTYDTISITAVSLFQIWNGSVWVNDRRSTYTYDVSGNRTSLTFEDWNEQFDNEQKLDDYVEEYGMTVREFRLMLYNSEKGTGMSKQDF